MKKAEAISILATSVRPREAKDRARYDEAVKMAIEALKSSEQTAESAQNVQDEDLISKLSEIRSEYNCFDEDGEPQYRALSEAIRILSQLADGDTISRQAALDAIMGQPPEPHYPSWYAAQIEKLPSAQPATSCSEIPNGSQDALDRAEVAIGNLPSVQPDLSEYSDKLWKSAYERGRAEAEADEDDWTLCSKRMPEEHEWIGTKKFGTTMSYEVYVTFENSKGERFTKHLHFYNGELSRYEKTYMDAWYKDCKPIAWKPLPEPYRGGDT